MVHAGNGGAGLIIDKLEPYLPFQFIKVHHEPDGTFPNGVPNPMLIENHAAPVEALRKHVLSATKLHADDTPVPVLSPGAGKTRTGRLWTYVRDDRPAGDETPPAVWFAYSPNRREQ